MRTLIEHNDFKLVCNDDFALIEIKHLNVAIYEGYIGKSLLPDSDSVPMFEYKLFDDERFISFAMPLSSIYRFIFERLELVLAISVNKFQISYEEGMVFGSIEAKNLVWFKTVIDTMQHPETLLAFLKAH